MSQGIYLGKDYHIHREEGYYAALRYLFKKREKKITRMSLWTAWLAAALVWILVWVLYYGY